MTRPALSARDRTLQRRFRLVGALILVVGMAASAVVFRTAKPDYDSALVKVLNNTKSREYQMEVIGGKANLFASDLRDWFSGLWHGRGLARTLAFLSASGFLACFWVAHRLNYAPPPEEQPRAGGP
jgi:hypothetical protein